MYLNGNQSFRHTVNSSLPKILWRDDCTKICFLIYLVRHLFLFLFLFILLWISVNKYEVDF